MALEAETKPPQKKDAKERRSKRRWGDAKPAATTETAAATSTAASAPLDSKAKVLSMQESIRARLAAAKAKQQQAVGVKRPAHETVSAETSQRTTKRAKHYELDLSVTGPSFQKQQRTKQQAPAAPGNPYLEYQHEEDDEEAIDDRLLRASKPRRAHKEFKFIEPGQYEAMAEKKRELAAKAEVSGYVSGRKVGHTIHAASMYGPSTGLDEGPEDETLVKPRADANPDTTMPLTLEWWDVELLPSKLKKQVAAAESAKLLNKSQAALKTLRVDEDEQTAQDTKEDGKPEVSEDGDDAATVDLRRQCWDQAALSYSKTAALVQHIVPIQPIALKAPKQAVLHLTQKERKRQRKLRRQEKQRQLQDLQAAGLVPAPEPRLTLSNFIKVLGDQAVLDPSQMEKKVAEQMQARQRAHWELNQSQKLTKEQRATKKAAKLSEDVSTGVSVAIFYVLDMSHPYHRTKVDLNAQQNYISGGVIECAHPEMACVIVEGGPKAIKRYTRLMTVRMKWTGPDDDVEENDDQEMEGDEDGPKPHKFNPNNKCELVWQGMAVKRLFKGFVFQSCETSNQARKILKGKGVGHYWDQVVQHASASGGNSTLPLRLADNDEPSKEDVDVPME